MFHYPLILNEDIPEAVFGELFQSTNNIIRYDGVISTGIIFHIVSTHLHALAFFTFATIMEGLRFTICPPFS